MDWEPPGCRYSGLDLVEPSKPGGCDAITSTNARAAAAQHMTFEALRKQELQALTSARARRGLPEPESRGFVGLALSGGNIRSATFALGILQGLARAGFLKRVDYLSATGGGSLIAGWLTSWISRRGFKAVQEGLTRQDPGLLAIDRLRDTICGVRSVGVSSPAAMMMWLRNVSLHMLTVLLLWNGLMLALSGALLYLLEVDSPLLQGGAVGFAAVSSFVMGVVARRREPILPGTGRAVLLCVGAIATVSAAVALAGFASGQMLTMREYNSDKPMLDLSYLTWRVAKWEGSAMAIFSLVAWPMRTWSVKAIATQLLSATFAAACTVTGVVTAHALGKGLALEGPVFVMAWAIGILLHAGLTAKWTATSVRNLALRYGSLLLAFSIFWQLSTFFAGSPLSQFSTDTRWLRPSVAGSWEGWVTAAAVLAVLGQTRQVLSRLPAGTWIVAAGALEQAAPYCLAAFVSLTYPVVAQVVSRIKGAWYPSPIPVAYCNYALLMVATAAVLLWLTRGNGFSMYTILRSRLSGMFLSPTAPQTPDEIIGWESVDLPLESLTSSNYDGPYPLFGAALQKHDSGSTMRAGAFLFSPLAVGGERAFRAVADYGNGRIGLSSAMTVSAGFRPGGNEHRGAAVAWMQEVFDCREGRGWQIPCAIHFRRRPARCSVRCTRSATHSVG